MKSNEFKWNPLKSNEFEWKSNKSDEFKWNQIESPPPSPQSSYPTLVGFIGIIYVSIMRMKIASDCEQKHKDIQILPLEMGRRPFPSWHRRCYFSVLAEALSLCRDRGITLKRIAAIEASCDRARSFQNIAEEAISSKFRDPYFRESRIRAHGVFWKFSVLPGHLGTRVLSRFRILAERAPLKVWFVYFRTMWNGWVTYDRMKQLLPPRPCLLGCGYDEDRVDHYCCCNVYWSFLRRPRPQGLGIQSERSKDTALLLNKSLSDEDVLRLAIGLYALYRTVNAVRFSEPHEAPSDFHRLLRMFAKQAVNASNGWQLWLPWSGWYTCRRS